MDASLVVKIIRKYDLVLISSVGYITIGSNSSPNLEYGMGNYLSEAVESFVNINEIDIDDLMKE